MTDLTPNPVVPAVAPISDEQLGELREGRWGWPTDAVLAHLDAVFARVLPEGVVEIDGQRFTVKQTSYPWPLRPDGAHPWLHGLIPYRPEKEAPDGE